MMSSDVMSPMDLCMDLLKHNNFRVSQGALQSLASDAIRFGDHFNAVLPAIVDLDDHVLHSLDWTSSTKLSVTEKDMGGERRGGRGGRREDRGGVGRRWRE